MRLLISKSVLTISLAVIAPTSVLGAEDSSWSCRNADFEISCSEGKCVNAQTHTPMEILVNEEEISWCAYSGCWSGTTSSTLASGPFLSFNGITLKNGVNPSDVMDVTIVIDTASNAASIMVSDQFATPATCEKK